VPGDLREDIGVRLRRMRKEAEISQEMLAERAGLHRNYVGSVERGERDVSVTVLAALVTALDSTLAEFFSAYTRSFKRHR
jgi:transcriptional regulator with XRE-family HTH domain